MCASFGYRVGYRQGRDEVLEEADRVVKLNTAEWMKAISDHSPQADQPP